MTDIDTAELDAIVDVTEGICFECKQVLLGDRIYCCESCEDKILSELEK